MMGCGSATEATGLGSVCFVVINPRALSANRVIRAFCFINVPILLTHTRIPILLASLKVMRTHHEAKTNTTHLLPQVLYIAANPTTMRMKEPLLMIKRPQNSLELTVLWNLHLTLHQQPPDHCTPRPKIVTASVYSLVCQHHTMKAPQLLLFRRRSCKRVLCLTRMKRIFQSTR
mgnify:CR=1 FL=1